MDLSNKLNQFFISIIVREFNQHDSKFNLLRRVEIQRETLGLECLLLFKDILFKLRKFLLDALHKISIVIGLYLVWLIRDNHVKQCQ